MQVNGSTQVGPLQKVTVRIEPVGPLDDDLSVFDLVVGDA
jgi:hypothetical protein